MNDPIRHMMQRLQESNRKLDEATRNSLELKALMMLRRGLKESQPANEPAMMHAQHPTVQ